VTPLTEKRNPHKAVTFVTTMTDEIYNKQLAYAILTHEGYPTLFTEITKNGWTKKNE
jgi:hypothetical protein